MKTIHWHKLWYNFPVVTQSCSGERAVSFKKVSLLESLALVQNAGGGGGGGGGAYTRDATISLAITPSLPGMKSLLVGGGDQAGGVAEREAERCSQR